MLEGRSLPGELHCRIVSSHGTRKWESKSNEEESEAPTENEAENENVGSDHFFPKQILKKKGSSFWEKLSEIVGLTLISFNTGQVTLMLQ